MNKQCSLCGRTIRPAAHAVLDHTNQLLCPNSCGKVYNALVERDRLFGRAGMMAMVAHAQLDEGWKKVPSYNNLRAVRDLVDWLMHGCFPPEKGERELVEAIAHLMIVLDQILEQHEQPD